MVQRRYLLRQIAPRSVMGKSRSEKVSTSKRERASMRTPALPMAQLLKRSLLSSIALMGVLTSEEHFLTASADGMEMLSSSSNWRRKLVVEASMESLLCIRCGVERIRIGSNWEHEAAGTRPPHVCCPKRFLAKTGSSFNDTRCSFQPSCQAFAASILGTSAGCTVCTEPLSTRVSERASLRLKNKHAVVSCHKKRRWHCSAIISGLKVHPQARPGIYCSAKPKPQLRPQQRPKKGFCYRLRLQQWRSPALY
uniref:Uncharacterized protein n=1 Tax=Phytophthora fragariae TaxID=53985 RepID=A0A6A3E2K8_9STRA|nr:hypothetical protein PF009_g23090 [Phytophthora fragariae]